jgi:hypothetical protein
MSATDHAKAWLAKAGKWADGGRPEVCALTGIGYALLAIAEALRDPR